MVSIGPPRNEVVATVTEAIAEGKGVQNVEWGKPTERGTSTPQKPILFPNHRCVRDGHRWFKPVFLNEEKLLFSRHCRRCPKVYIGEIITDRNTRTFKVLVFHYQGEIVLSEKEVNHAQEIKTQRQTQSKEEKTLVPVRNNSQPMLFSSPE